MESATQTRKLLEAWLRSEYGLLIDSAATARILGYRNANTLAKARSRGVLPLEMFPVEGRQGFFTSPKYLAAYLQVTLPPQHLPTRGGSEGWITASSG